MTLSELRTMNFTPLPRNEAAATAGDAAACASANYAYAIAASQGFSCGGSLQSYLDLIKVACG